MVKRNGIAFSQRDNKRAKTRGGAKTGRGGGSRVKLKGDWQVSHQMKRMKAESTINFYQNGLQVICECTQSLVNALLIKWWLETSQLLLCEWVSAKEKPGVMKSERTRAFRWQRTGCRVCWGDRSVWFLQKQLPEYILLPWKWSPICSNEFPLRQMAPFSHTPIRSSRHKVNVNCEKICESSLRDIWGKTECFLV